MSVVIEPRIEVLYNDLNNHSIGKYLTSRDFKVMMSKNGYYTGWQATYENIKNERLYFSVGLDHEYFDNLDTLAAYLNASNDKDYEDIVTKIIVSFIENKKYKEDFTDVIESMVVANFSEQSVNLVKNVVEKHQSSDLQVKEKNPEVSKNQKKEKNITTSIASQTKDIFIVHGHNEILREKVARTLEKLKLNPIILNEQSDEGQTIIEKFEKHSNVGFAIVLLTYDDFGNIKSSDTKNKRARQNVILELGYFIGKLGRSRVMPLYENGVELPSDISGVLYTPIDESENWKFRLVKELKVAKYEVDANDIL